jgi:hypothetical protein
MKESQGFFPSALGRDAPLTAKLWRNCVGQGGKREEMFECPNCHERFEEGARSDGHHEHTCRQCRTFIQWDDGRVLNDKDYVSGGGPSPCEHPDRLRPGAQLPTPVVWGLDNGEIAGCMGFATGLLAAAVSRCCGGPVRHPVQIRQRANLATDLLDGFSIS